MSDTTEIQASEDVTLPETREPTQPEITPEDEQGFDIVLNDDEHKPKQDPDTNKKFAARRVARKRQRELEQAVEAAQRGEVPEDLRVKPELPPMPDVNDYLSDAALEKYGFDTNRAAAALSAAQSEWQLKALDARSNAVAEQGRKTQEYTRQSTQFVDAARAHYDAAEKLGLPDFDEKEEVARSILPPGVDAQIMQLFPEKSAALMYHLGANPEKLRSLLAMSPQQSLIELTRLSDRMTIKPLGKEV